MDTKTKLFSFEEVPESTVPVAKKRVSSFEAQAEDEWKRLTKTVAETEPQRGGALKINLEPATGKLRGIKHPGKVLLRKLKEFVRARNLPRDIFYREGAIYVMRAKAQIPKKKPARKAA